MQAKEQVNSVLCFGSESWSWIKAILDKGCETEAMRRVFRFNRKDDETLTGLLYGDGGGSKNNLRCMAKYTRIVKVDRNNHTRWKHNFGWHNRLFGCDNIASEWSGNGDLNQKKKGQKGLLTLSMLSANTRSRTGQAWRVRKVEQREERAEDIEATRRVVSPSTEQSCGDINVVEKWTDGQYTIGGREMLRVL